MHVASACPDLEPNVMKPRWLTAGLEEIVFYSLSEKGVLNCTFPCRRNRTTMWTWFTQTRHYTPFIHNSLYLNKSDFYAAAGDNALLSTHHPLHCSVVRYIYRPVLYLLYYFHCLHLLFCPLFCTPHFVFFFSPSMKNAISFYCTLTCTWLEWQWKSVSSLIFYLER